MAIYDPASGQYYATEEERQIAAMVRREQEDAAYRSGGQGMMDAISSGWNWLVGGGLAGMAREPVPPPESSEEAYRRFRMQAYGSPEGPYGGPEPMGPQRTPGPAPAGPTPMYTPPGVPPQNFPQGDPAAQWRQFVESGGKEMKYDNGTTLKYKKPESPEEKARKQQANIQAGGGAPPQKAGPPPSQISGPYPMSSEQVGPRPGDEGPGQAPPPPPPSPSYPARDADRRERAAKIQYSTRYPSGEEPMTPMEWERRKRALIEQKAIEQERLLQESMPEKGALLARAYERINRSTGKGTRILLGILSGNPFWADSIASMEAEDEARRAATMGKERRDISSNRYNDLIGLVDGLEKRQNDHKAVVAAELKSKLETEPELIYNRTANRDYALTLGIHPSLADQFLDDHYDAKTGVYNLLKDPWEENLIRAKNEANTLLELYPYIPREVAIAATKHPTLLLEMASNESKLYEVKALHEKDPTVKADYLRRADLLKARSQSIAQSPEMRKVVMLEDIRKNASVWDKMTTTEKEQWYTNYSSAHKSAFGPSAEKEPRQIYLKQRQEEEDLKGKILENRQRQLQIEKGAADSKDVKGATNNIYNDAALKTYPLLSHKKVSAAAIEEAYAEQKIILTMMAQNQMPTGNTPLEADMRQKADIIKQEVWKYIPPNLQQQLGELSYSEAAIVAQAIYSAQANGEVRQTPNIPVIVEYIRQSREGQKKTKKR